MDRVKIVDYSPWSPDLTPLNFYLQGDLKKIAGPKAQN
jgi:hypothetical protein